MRYPRGVLLLKNENPPYNKLGPGKGRLSLASFVGSEMIEEQIQCGAEDAVRGRIARLLGFYVGEQDAVRRGIDRTDGCVAEFGATAHEGGQEQGQGDYDEPVDRLFGGLLVCCHRAGLRDNRSSGPAGLVGACRVPRPVARRGTSAKLLRFRRGTKLAPLYSRARARAPRAGAGLAVDLHVRANITGIG